MLSYNLYEKFNKLSIFNYFILTDGGVGGPRLRAVGVLPVRVLQDQHRDGRHQGFLNVLHFSDDIYR